MGVEGEEMMHSISHLSAAGLPVLKNILEYLGMPWK